MQSAGQEGCPVLIFFGQWLFKCGRPHFFLLKPASNFSKFIVSPHLTWTGGGKGRGTEPVLTIFWTIGSQFFMILCSRPLWIDPEQKNNSKVKHGL